MAKLLDCYGNQIELTDERWNHIITGHPELEDYYEEVLKTIQNGRRRQDTIDERKYKYIKDFGNLPLGFTHLVIVVKLIKNNFILTAYGIER